MFSFAIVTPNLNQSHFLNTALESIRYQSVPFNLALMDGGSIDNLSQVVKKYKDIITYFKSSPDNGQSAAISEGIKKISGNIVSWLNADDFYFPHALDKVAKCFQENPDLDVIYGDAIHVSPEGFFLSYFPTIQNFSIKKLKRTCFICQPACFVRSTAYHEVGGVDPSLHYTMDWDLWCRLANSEAKFYYLNEVLAAVRCYQGTKTLSRNWKRYMEIWRIERKYGFRVLPRSWMGSYLFDLCFQKRKSLSQEYAFALLHNLRRLKKRLINKKDLKNDSVKTNYGFHHWEPIVERRCMIHVPWYDKREWTKLYLRVDPIDNEYRIEINDQFCEHTLSEEGYLIAKVQPLVKPYRKISIESLNEDSWKLLEFRCDLEN